MIVNKYDRQIRLWGTLGQKRLSEANVALLGSSGAGIEALKNLVLPGIGHISVWDDRTVQQEDLSSSFFYAPEDVGRSRAQAIVQNLTQMNPDVTGQAFNKPIDDLIKDKVKLKSYSLVICSDLLDSKNHQISQICWQLDIPVVFITVIGFIVYVRNQRKMHFVQNQNITSKKYYMRLHDPFPALKQHSNQWNIEQMLVAALAEPNIKIQKEMLDIIQNIPYPIALIQASQSLPVKERKKQNIVQVLDRWISPFNFDFRNIVQAKGRTLDYFQTPDNYLDNLDIFDHPEVTNANINSQPILLFLKATKQFLTLHKHLPQSTSMPDMHSTTLNYLSLKNTYKLQHENDVNEIQNIIIHLCQNEAPSLGNKQISEFIQHLNNLKIIQMIPYFQELEKIDNPNLKWENIEWRNILVAIRAYKLFEDQFKNAPKSEDFEKIKEFAESIKHQYCLQTIDDRYLREVSRVQGKTTISINSIAGALTGQQSIKLITRCFTPVKSGFIYSGIHSIGYSVSL